MHMTLRQFAAATEKNVGNSTNEQLVRYCWLQITLSQRCYQLKKTLASTRLGLLHNSRQHAACSMQQAATLAGSAAETATSKNIANIQMLSSFSLFAVQFEPK